MGGGGGPGRFAKRKMVPVIACMHVGCTDNIFKFYLQIGLIMDVKFIKLVG